MKKFLSLVLALVMALSLVTISAGATEYKDLTDKEEITYEEAVAVLNRIGIITGYDDGSFKPEGELTRGAAAKIIVSLMIGPEAASALTNNVSPYPDVPSGYTFAGVISYCKTAGYISGYGDGTFKPGNSLTGYAFAKMLLGAIGYNSDIEGFTGSGWTMNVARIGNVAGLFDRLQFDGSKSVNREEACQLALNTLKATLVTYGGSTIISGSTGSFTMQGTTATYVTSNNKEINGNINNRVINATNNELTLEFGEEHFVNLRLEHDKYNPTLDDFGRPSNEWSYKKVTIGTFPLEADFTFTEQKAHLADKDASKVRALGLTAYECSTTESTHGIASGYNKTQVFVNGQQVDDLDKVARIADYTDNGATVNVYVDELDADFISYVAVIQPMMVKIKNVKSDTVSFELIEADDKGAGFNQYALDNYNDGAQRGMNEIDKLEDLETEDDYFDVVKDLKAGDRVVVIPVNADHDGDTWEVGKAYVPETAAGKLTDVETYDDDVVTITVGGTTYKVSQWNLDMKDIDADKIKVTIKDVTLYLDETGNALWVDEVGATSDYMIIGSWSQTLANGKIVNVVDGWDINGNPVSLNVGRIDYEDHLSASKEYVPGDVVKYTNSGAPSSGDWLLLNTDDDGTPTTSDKYEDLVKIYEVSEFGLENDMAYAGVKTGTAFTGAQDPDYEIRSSNVRLALRGDNVTFTQKDGGAVVGQGKVVGSDVVAIKSTASGDAGKLVGSTASTAGFYFAKDVKFIYVDFNEDDEVEGVEVMKSRQNVSTAELLKTSANNGGAGYHSAQAVVDKNGEVKAVVIKTQSNSAKTNNLLYVRDHWGKHTYTTETGKVYGVVAIMMTDEGIVEKNIYVDKDLDKYDFATFSLSEKEGYEPFYKVKEYDSQTKTTSVMKTVVNGSGGLSYGAKYNKWLINLGNGTNYPTNSNGHVLINAAPNAAAPYASWILSDKRGTSDQINDSSAAIGMANFSQAEWINLTDKTDIDEPDDLDDYIDVVLHLVVNDNGDSDNFRSVALAVVVSGTKVTDQAAVPAPVLTISPAKASYAAGEEITLSVNLSNADKKFGTLTYEYLNSADGTTWATKQTHASTATSDTFKTTFDPANPYWSIKVTNKDSKFTIDTKSTTVAVSGTGTSSGQIVVDGSSMTYDVAVTVTDGVLADANGIPVSSPVKVTAAGTIFTVLPDAGKENVTATATGKATVRQSAGNKVIIGWNAADASGDPDAVAITCAAPESTEKSVAITCATGDGRVVVNGKTYKDSFPIDGSATVEIMTTKDDATVAITAGANTTVSPMAGGKYLVELTDPAENGAVTLTVTANPHTLKITASAPTNYTIDSVAVNGTTVTKGDAAGASPAGVTVNKGDVVTVVLKQDATHGGAITLATNIAKTFTTTSGFAAGTDFGATKSDGSAASGSWVALTGGSEDTEFAAAWAEVAASDGAKELYANTSASDTGATQITTEPADHGSYTHVKVLTKEVLGTITVTFTVGAGDCTLSAWTLI